MKLYDSEPAPNPRRVRIFLAEKGISIDTVQVNISSANNREPDFLAINPLGTVPVLELDDGKHLSESVAICRYFEELHPNPNLLGANTRERAFIEMWNRRMELELLRFAAESFRNTHDFFKGRIPQVPEFGRVAKELCEKSLDWLDNELADREFIAGDRYTIADITALCGIDFGRVTKIRIQDSHKHLARWHKTVSSRPSAQA